MRNRDHAALIGLTIFGIWMVLIWATNAYAQENLTFFAIVPEVSTDITFEVLSYKELRSREICAMAKAEGFSDKDCILMIAHLYTENGSMSEDGGWKKGSSSNDYGYAIGIAQWHVCWRHPDWSIKHGYCWRTEGGGMAHGISNASKMREHYFQDFPEMKDWRNQAARYIGELKNSGKPLKKTIDDWNSHPDYMSRVNSKVSVARSLLAL